MGSRRGFFSSQGASLSIARKTPWGCHLTRHLPHWEREDVVKHMRGLPS